MTPKVLCSLLAATLMTGGLARAADAGSGAFVFSDDIEAIVTKTRNGYRRTMLDNGRFRSETYRFSKGEVWGGELADPSIDKMTLDDIARDLAPALARQDYVPARGTDAPQLLIVVNWGTTDAPEYRSMIPPFQRVEDAQMRLMGGPSASPGHTSVMDAVLDGHQEALMNGSANSTGFDDAQSKYWNRINIENAKMLGYNEEGGAQYRSDLDRFRYFIVLLAYDFKSASARKRRLLWEARMSFSEHHVYFNEALPALVSNAADLLGRDSDGFTRRPIAQGRVIIGELKSLEFPKASAFASISGNGNNVAFLKRRQGDIGVAVVDVAGLGGVRYAELPKGTQAAGIRWSDDGHATVETMSGDEMAYDLASGGWGRLPSGWHPAAEAPVQESTASKARDKFGGREVEVLGADAPGDRCLVSVSKGSVTRYYVYDQTGDFIVEVGKTEFAR